VYDAMTAEKKRRRGFGRTLAAVMGSIVGVLLGLILFVYVLGVVAFTPYYNWRYANAHGFLQWLTFGELEAELQAFSWPYDLFNRIAIVPAEQSDANAQLKLGLAAQDDAEAVRWFRKAADQGLALAQDNLGGMYANGRGVRQDDAEAVQWHQRAANQGIALAQNNLGYMYANAAVCRRTTPKPSRCIAKPRTRVLRTLKITLAVCTTPGEVCRTTPLRL